MKYENFDTFSKSKGKTFPPTPWLEVTQQMIDDFASATHDHQWIHSDEERAKKELPEGKTIAHGFLSLSLITKFLSEAVQVSSLKKGYNAAIEKVRFLSPVMVGSLLRGIVTVHDLEVQKFGGLKIVWKIKIEIQGVKKPACMATMTTLAFE